MVWLTMYKKSVKSRIKKEDLNPVFYFQTEDDEDKVLSKALIKTALKSGNLNLANKGLGSGMWIYFNRNFELNSVLEVQKNVCFVNIPQPQGHVKKDEKSINSNLSIFVKQTLILEVFSDYLVSIIFALHNEMIIIWFFYYIRLHGQKLTLIRKKSKNMIFVYRRLSHTNVST